MKYLSLCSGIEAATVAWQSLGWEAVAFAEIEPFPCEVLKHHYPNVPNLGDISQIDGRQFRGAVELIVAGTPCQDFSIAGKRAGMAGERSGLAREFVRLVREINPRWIVWENVPGVFSTNGGRDFGSFIKALDDSGYSCAWRVLDAQFFGVPQRRRRVFVVGYFGDWRPAAKILFESESLHRNFTPRSEKRQNIAGTVKGGSGKCRQYPCKTGTLTGNMAKGTQDENMCKAGFYIPHWRTGTLTGRSARGSCDDNMAADGFCIPCEVLALRTAQTSANGHGIAENVSHTLDQANGQAIAFAQNQCGEIRTSDVFGTINQNSNASGRNTPMLAYAPPIVEQAISCKWAKGSSGPAGDEHHNLIAIQPNHNRGDSYNASTQKRNTGKILRILREEIGEETFAKWGFGILGSFFSPEILRQAVHGTSIRPAAFSKCWLVHCALSCPQNDSSWLLQSLREAGCERCTSYRWKPSEQLSRELGAYLSELSLPGPQAERFLSDLWEASEGSWVLQQTLYALQKIWRSTGNQMQSGRQLQVRRLTPTECEFLMGFPRNYTAIEYRGKPAPDSARYKALGNSMAVPVMRWIGKRIDDFEKTPEAKRQRDLQGHSLR